MAMNLEMFFPSDFILCALCFILFLIFETRGFENQKT
jgi:hypothetical protein